jgi:hypothetical protein
MSPPVYLLCQTSHTRYPLSLVHHRPSSTLMPFLRKQLVRVTAQFPCVSLLSTWAHASHRFAVRLLLLTGDSLVVVSRHALTFAFFASLSWTVRCCLLHSHIALSCIFAVVRARMFCWSDVSLCLRSRGALARWWQCAWSTDAPRMTLRHIQRRMLLCSGH